MRYEVASYHTKKMFADALKEIMREKPFSKITVSELVANCKVNRKTFYYHFSDLNALRGWTLEQESKDIVKEYRKIEDHDKAFQYFVDRIIDDQFLKTCMVENPGSEEIRQAVTDDFNTLANEYFTAKEERYGCRLDEGHKTFAAAFLTRAVTGLVFAWLNNDRGYSRDQLMRELTATMDECAEGVMGSAR